MQPGVAHVGQVLVGESKIIVHKDDLLSEACMVEGVVSCNRCMTPVGFTAEAEAEDDGNDDGHGSTQNVSLYKCKVKDPRGAWKSYGVDSILGERVLAEGETSGRRHFCLVAIEDGLPRASLSIIN